MFIVLGMYNFGAALTVHDHPALSEKLPKLHFLTHASNSKKMGAKLLLLKCFESCTKWHYPKHVSGSVMPC